MSGTKVNETKPNETKPRRVVGRSIAIALGIVCILLIAVLGGVMAYYVSYVSGHHHTDSDYDSINSIVNLANSTVWVNNQTISQPAGQFTNWTESVNYSGFVIVNVLSANATVLAQVSYFSWSNYFYYALSYDTQKTVNPSHIVWFPVLPSSNVTVGVGNGNLVDGATETVTITYYY
jgi:flagellar basal body-associated protein FliL